MLDFDRLNELLKSKGVKKSFLADQLGKNRSIFSDWEAGKSQPKPEYITIIATLLGTTPAYLTGESDDPGQTAGASVIIGVFGYSLCLHAVSHCYLLQDR